jgi:hypothetical protein
MSVEFGVLGPLQICVDGAPVPLGTPKQRAVLAMLLINRNRPVATDALIYAAWEQFPPPDPRASLHSYVSNLRKLLGSVGLDSRTALVSAPPGYRLNVPENNCDIGRFVLGKTAGVQAAAAGKFEQASKSLSAALSEWRGPVLEDLRDFQFVDAFATALVEDKVLAHTALDTAIHTANSLDQRTAVGAASSVAPLRDASGEEYQLVAAATRIGRLPDNDIVLDDANVSRHHAVIIDTDTSFVVTDLRSANGVEVRGERIRASVTLVDGDRVRICDHEFTFEVQLRDKADAPS